MTHRATPAAHKSVRWIVLARGHIALSRLGVSARRTLLSHYQLSSARTYAVAKIIVAIGREMGYVHPLWISN